MKRFGTKEEFKFYNANNLYLAYSLNFLTKIRAKPFKQSVFLPFPALL